MATIARENKAKHNCLTAIGGPQLESIPHPHEYMAKQGLTMKDYAKWMFVHGHYVLLWNVIKSFVKESDK